MNAKITIGEDKKTYIVENLFPGKLSKVWDAWSKPEVFVKWWGPFGWKTEISHMDFKNGGYLLYGMKCEDPEQKDWFGKTSWGISKYVNIDPYKTIEYTDEFCDENGKVDENMPFFDIKLEFVDENESTRVISTSVFDSPGTLEMLLKMGMQEGTLQTWERLEALLSDKDE